MLKIFIGYDHRQPVSYNVLQQSILSLSSKPVSITPLVLSQLPIKRQGLTPFTYSRFLVPYLCDYEGFALFLDADMLLTADIAELFEYIEDLEAVRSLSSMDIREGKIFKKEVELPKAAYVVKNKEKFEWASAIMFNCSHPSNQILTPEYIETAENLHAISWLKNEEIVELPPEWNKLVGYDNNLEEAKLLHFTQGVPVFEETENCPMADKWHEMAIKMTSAVSWNDLMGGSVHAINCNGKMLPKFMFDLEKRQPKPEYQEIVKKLIG